MLCTKAGFTTGQCSSSVMLTMFLHAFPGVEISDEEAEKILTAKDAAELLKKKLDIH